MVLGGVAAKQFGDLIKSYSCLDEQVMQSNATYLNVGTGALATCIAARPDPDDSKIIY